MPVITPQARIKHLNIDTMTGRSRRQWYEYRFTGWHDSGSGGDGGPSNWESGAV